MQKKHLPTLILTLALYIPAAFSETGQPNTYSPYANMDYPDNVYWGDTHVHTSLSPDAYTFGTRLTPDDAYRFARGETVLSNSGQPVRLHRPLDFVLVADHGAFLGVFPMLDAKDPQLANTALGKRWLDMYANNQHQGVVMEFINAIAGDGANKLVLEDSVKEYTWHQVTAAADKYNEPGKFTAFIGYEWTSMPQGRNLHRNMVFLDNADKANRIIPLTSLDTMNPEDLWQYLADYEDKTGGRVLAIPHNANVSNGLMFSDKTFAGDPLTAQWATTRMRWEPIVEVTQIKGDGEAHPYLSPDDEFADYETWDQGSLGMTVLPKEKWMLKHEYARGALKLGLELDQALGVNPYKFGMIGSTDSHTALAAVEENNFFGKFGQDEPSPERATKKLFPDSELGNERYAASGYAAVWARENTRQALFDAMQRKETYATTGPRMMVRFFGGWDFEANDDKRPDYVAAGYQKGVPMGGDLAAAPAGKVPRFLIVASKDPDGANLDRIQVVKGWLKADGTAAEKVYNVAVSDSRAIRNNQTPALKSTVNIETATYTNSVGASQLSVVWPDPDFDPSQKAFYYVRVLEIATPRWSTYDAAFYGTSRPKDYPVTQQERAYTSPIWYTP